MGHSEQRFFAVITVILTIIGLLLAALAVPLWQPWLEAQLAETYFLSTVVLALCVALLLAVVAYVFRDQIASRLRAISPKHRLETRYLRAVERYLRRTPALLVISERHETHTELDLLAAYSQLTLGPDPDQPDAPLVSPTPTVRRGGIFGLAGGKEDDDTLPRSLRRSLFDMLIWVLAHGALLGVALFVIRGLLFDPSGAFRLTWGGALLSFAIALVWLGLAVLLQRFVLRRFATMLDERGACSAPPATPGAEIWEHRRLLIMGDPGSGKTTLLRHIAVVCAQELLHLPGRQPLREAYGWPERPFPIYIPLRALREAASARNRPLLESYAETLREVALLGDVVRDLPPDFFQRRAALGGCIILLDAFDELRDAEARRRLGRLVADLPPGPEGARNRVVVTSRIVGYEGQLRGPGFDFTHRRLADLTDRQSAEFVRQRYKALATLGVRAPGEQAGVTWDPEARAQRLISRLPENPGLRRLGRNPFLLSLIISVHLKSPRELPRQRHALYERAMAMLVEEWERWKDSELDLEPTTPAADLEADLKLRLLYELAWAMYERTLDAPGDRSHTIITSDAAEQVLAGALREIPTIVAGRTGETLDAFCSSEAKRWLRNLGQRGGVLQALGNVAGRSEEQIQFAHQTFQEYLASQAIDSSVPEIQRLRANRVRERWNDERWREVLLLYSSTSADATPIVRHLLARNDEYANLLAGSVLAEQPRRLEQAPLEEVIDRLRRLALAANVSASTALDALNTLAETGLDPVEKALGRAALSAPQTAVRVRAVELLAGMDTNRPAPASLAPHVQNLMLRLLKTEPEPRLRLAAGFALARGDPRYDNDGWIPELVHVPAGPFLMGSEADDKEAQDNEKLQQRLELPDYWIARTPVTNAQWRCFVEAGGYRKHRYWSRGGRRWLRCGWEPEGNYSMPQGIAIIVLGPLFDPLVGLLLRRRPFSQPHPESWDDPDWNGANQPISGISFYEAEAYCAWLSEAIGHPFRLPSEAEWEKAARGAEGRCYPWGDVWEEGRCNSKEAGIHKPSPVGSFPGGAGPRGTLDMAGNVWEWCETRWQSYYPWRKPELGNRLIDVLAWWANVRVFRGGSYYNERQFVRGASRSNFFPRDRFYNQGLRVASHSPMPGSDS